MLFYIFLLYIILLSYCFNFISCTSKAPHFFLIDPDGLCLGGSTYTRCSIDTVWYVQGKPGTYQLHHLNENNDEVCLLKEKCNSDNSNLQLGSCNHCGSKKWNILGDTNTNFVLTEDNDKYCVKKIDNIATIIKCNIGYSELTLQLVTKDEINIMKSRGVKLIQAATNNDLLSLKSYIIDDIDVNSRDWDGLTPLIAASTNGHFNIVKHLIINLADPNLFDKNNITAIMETAMAGFFDIFQYLYHSGADIELRASSGVNCLWVASNGGHTNIVNFLLSKKSNPNIKRIDGVSAIMTACSNGHLNIVKNLINSGATVNDKDESNLTPLIYAAENGHLEIVKILLENKANVNVLSDNGFSPLIISAAYGHFEIVQMLVNAGAIIDMKHPDNVTPLMYAVAGGNENIVRYLIDKGSNINQIDIHGNSAILEAATSGNIEVIYMLLNAGAIPSVINKNGLNTVMLAASQGRIDAVNLFLTKDININDTSFSGVTAIMYSVGGGHYDTTKILIDNGADINKVINNSHINEEFIDEIELYKNGVSLLIMAIQVGNLNIVELLLKNGIDINKPDINGITPFIISMKEKKFDIAYYLLRNNCDFVDHYIDDDYIYHSLLMDSIQVSNIELSLFLIKKGANILYVDEAGISIALQASFLNLYDVIFELINRNVDMNLVNNEGMSPLIVAASEGNLKTIQTLLKYSKNLDINIKDKDNTTALMTACVRGHKDIVNELNMVADIDLNAQNIDGHTALMFAYNGKNQVEILYNKYSKYKQNDMDETYNIIKLALENHIYIISLLIDNGSDISIRDNDGHVAIDFDYKPPLSIKDKRNLINHNIEL